MISSRQNSNSRDKLYQHWPDAIFQISTLLILASFGLFSLLYMLLSRYGEVQGTHWPSMYPQYQCKVPAFSRLISYQQVMHLFFQGPGPTKQTLRSNTTKSASSSPFCITFVYLSFNQYNSVHVGLEDAPCLRKVEQSKVQEETEIMPRASILALMRIKNWRDRSFSSANIYDSAIE